MFLLWRFNLLHLIVIAIGGSAIILAHTLVTIRARVRSEISRGACSAAVLVAFLLVPPATSALIGLRIEGFKSLGLGFVSVDPWPGYAWVALAGAIFTFATARLFSRRGRCYLSCFGFAVANSIWGGSPGWAGWIGFPFWWYRYSDAQLTFDGSSPSPWTPGAAVADGIIFVAVLFTLLLIDRRGRHLAEKRADALPRMSQPE